ncbi:MAG: amidohydrolase family protein [Clostridia bacterium]|nr:amidohydrolase family protein [Clostridia bacterium]
MKYAFVGGYVLNGHEDMRPVEGLAVLVADDKIEKIASSEELDLTGYEIVDIKGKYLMPGLVNPHVHLAVAGNAPKANAKPVNYKKVFKLLNIPFVKPVMRRMSQGYAKDELLSGVTTLRAVGGILDFDGKIRDNINSGKALGPRILACNTAVSVPGGHFAGSLATEAESPEMAREHVRQIHATNPDWIKIMVTGGVMDATEDGEPGILRMPPEIVEAACDEAHKLGYKVAAHVESPEGVRVALEGGVDTIEHGAQPDEEIVKLFKETGSAEICTISPALPYCLFDLEVSHTNELGKRNGTIVMNGIIECAKKCLEEGIPVGIGTDTGCPFIRHYDMWREICYFVKYCDVTPAFALYTATKRNAEIIGVGDITGTIDEGKFADIIVSDDNPLENLKTLKNLSMVMANGKLIRNPKIKKDEFIDKELDKYL